MSALADLRWQHTVVEVVVVVVALQVRHLDVRQPLDLFIQYETTQGEERGRIEGGGAGWVSFLFRQQSEYIGLLGKKQLLGAWQHCCCSSTPGLFLTQTPNCITHT